MAITRKPKPETRIGSRKVDVDALIERGGTVAKRTVVGDEEKQVPVILRVPEDILGKVDNCVKTRRTQHRIKTSRNNWLVEAVIEKLERESV
jgi:hypothetical protein